MQLNAFVTINALLFPCHILWLSDKPLTERVYLRWCICTLLFQLRESLICLAQFRARAEGLTLLWWWSECILCSHCCHSWASGDLWFPQCTWVTGKREFVSRTGSQECWNRRRISVNKSGLWKYGWVTKFGEWTCLYKAISRVKSVLTQWSYQRSAHLQWFSGFSGDYLMMNI